MTDPMPDARLAEIEARANAATGGPWEWRPDYAEPPDADDADERGLALAGSGNAQVVGAYNYHCCSMRIDPDVSDADQAFIAAAREDVPELVAEVRRLRAENRRRDDVIRSLRSVPDHPGHDCEEIARARMAWEDRCHALEQQLVDGAGPDHLTVGECARCGKPALIPKSDPENLEMAVCSQCSHELALAECPNPRDTP